MVYLFNASCFPSVGTYLKHWKYSHLEIYSELEPLIFQTIWHWWWLFFGVELATEETNLKWETGSITGLGLLHTYGQRSSRSGPNPQPFSLSTQEMQSVLFLGIKTSLKDPQHFPQWWGQTADTLLPSVVSGVILEGQEAQPVARRPMKTFSSLPKFLTPEEQRTYIKPSLSYFLLISQLSLMRPEYFVCLFFIKV